MPSQNPDDYSWVFTTRSLHVLENEAVELSRTLDADGAHAQASVVRSAFFDLLNELKRIAATVAATAEAEIVHQEQATRVRGSGGQGRDQACDPAALVRARRRGASRAGVAHPDPRRQVALRADLRRRGRLRAAATPARPTPLASNGRRILEASAPVLTCRWISPTTSTSGKSGTWLSRSRSSSAWSSR
jgi:hypothetical protein